ncbi:MAG: DNA recombination/repair protein RecA, partial [Cyanobacteria bacterium P01_C01_bin.72]
YKGDNVGQGRDNTIKYLLENPEVGAEIEAKVRDSLKPQEGEAVAEVTAEEADAEE